MNNYFLYKRFFDIYCSIFLIIILSPLLIIISLLIKLTSKGPILYKHLRVGQNNTNFYCLKFRTMYFESDKLLANLLNKNKKLEIEFNQKFKLRHDPRITLFGKFLRKTSLDELPQFINVILGDMSLIGPRPIVEKEKINYGNQIDTLLSIKPGITGLWQVSGRSKLSYPERKKMDIHYVRNYNFLLDLKIFFKTIIIIILPINKGAF